MNLRDSQLTVKNERIKTGSKSKQQRLRYPGFYSLSLSQAPKTLDSTLLIKQPIIFYPNDIICGYFLRLDKTVPAFTV